MRGVLLEVTARLQLFLRNEVIPQYSMVILVHVVIGVACYQHLWLERTRLA